MMHTDLFTRVPDWDLRDSDTRQVSQPEIKIEISEFGKMLRTPSIINVSAPEPFGEFDRELGDSARFIKRYILPLVYPLIGVDTSTQKVTRKSPRRQVDWDGHWSISGDWSRSIEVQYSFADHHSRAEDTRGSYRDHEREVRRNVAWADLIEELGEESLERWQLTSDYARLDGCPPWYIRRCGGRPDTSPSCWSEAAPLGWTSLEQATAYTAQERDELPEMPLGGEWVEVVDGVPVDRVINPTPQMVSEEDR